MECMIGAGPSTYLGCLLIVVESMMYSTQAAEGEGFSHPVIHLSGEAQMLFLMIESLLEISLTLVGQAQVTKRSALC